jgi:hypothetical protein
MAARPRKTPEKGVKRPTKAEREAAKALPESLIPKRNPKLDSLKLPYEKLSVALMFEIQESGICLLDAVVAAYVLMRTLCHHQGVHVSGAFADFHDMAERGTLKAYMEEHNKSCPHNPSNR